jgi:integrase
VDISPLHVEELLQNKLKNGLSAKTVRNLIVLLQGIFALGVDNDLIPRSPVRNRHKPSVVRCEKPVWTAEQVRSIIEKVPERHQPLFTCVALTGLRLGELLALQWKHVDLAESKLRIEQSIWHGTVVPPKTAGSVRTIPFGHALANAFAGHSQRSPYRAPDHFVFCKPDGSPLHPDVLRKDVLYPALDKLSIPRPKGAAGFHTFRHSAASFIASQTGNLKLAQKLLGHSNLSTTANVYTHTFANEEREAALAVERAIYGDLFPIVPKIQTGNKTPVVQ